MAAAAQAAIIIECVPEILELKKSVFEQLGRHCPPEAIYVTNTSSLVPSQLAGSCPHSERMAALHFHLPVALSNVVDLMPHPGTDPTVVAALDAFAREIGQIPIHYKQEYHGYIFNSIFGAMQQQALDLVPPVTNHESLGGQRGGERGGFHPRVAVCFLGASEGV